MRRGGRRGALTRHGFDLGPADRGGPRRTEGRDELRASHLPSGEPCLYNRSMASGEPSSLGRAMLLQQKHGFGRAVFYKSCGHVPAKRFYKSCGGPRGAEGGADVDKPRFWAVAVDRGGS